jgi:hypothetical protein
MLLVMVFVAVGGAGGDLVVMLVMGLVDLGLGWCGMTLVRGTCGRCNSNWFGRIGVIVSGAVRPGTMLSCSPVTVEVRFV